jgi:polysaccharide transporter, PST family
MSLVKNSLLNAVAVAVKVSSALVLNKLLAVMLGPAGYTLIGQFQNAVGLVSSLVSGTVTIGVTKYTAEYFDDEPRQHTIWQTACRLMLYLSLGAAIGITLFREPLSILLFKRPDFSDVFVWFAVALPGLALNAVLLAIINGKKEFRSFVLSNIAGNLVSLCVVGILAWKMGLRGALIAFGLSQSAAVIATLGLAHRVGWFSLRALWGKIDSKAMSNLLKFVAMAATTAVCAPLSQILVRDHLTVKFGLAAAGYWQAVTKISDIYLMMVTLTLSAYYLPRIAEIREAKELKAEIRKVYGFVLPLAACGALIIFLLRDFIVSVLFTPDFRPMITLFAWQLTGDVIKIGSWILGYILVGRASTGAFVVTEVLFSVSLVLVTMLLTPRYGLQGAVISFSLNYLIHWFFMYILTNREFKIMSLEVS